MIDIVHQLQAIHREVATAAGEDAELVAVRIRRTYDAQVEDVWDALTDPDRVKRWFLPLSGTLKVGGSFQLEGNAGGEILDCEPPSLLRLTFGGPSSLVQVRLSAEGDERTVLDLEHTVPLAMAGSGAGALFVGPGWDGAVMALALFLAGEVSDDPVAAASSPEAQDFSRQSVDLWVSAVEQSGTAGSDEVAAARDMSLAQFSPDTTTGA